MFLSSKITTVYIYADLVRQYDELKLKDNKFYDVELPRFSQASTVYTRISIFYTL